MSLLLRFTVFVVGLFLSLGTLAQTFNAVGNNANGMVTFTYSNPNPYGMIRERVGSPTAPSNVVASAGPGTNLTATITRPVGTYYYYMESCVPGAGGINCTAVQPTRIVTITLPPPPPSPPPAGDPANDSMSEPVYNGALVGSQTVGADGSLNYSVPIQLPAGINGMQPKLQLSYNSNRRNGLLGWGWQVSGLSMISRCPASLVRDGYVSGINNGDAYKFCLDGQRLVEVGVNDYRTEGESFLRIQKAGDYWIVTDNAGMQTRYGYNGDSRQEDIDGASRAWYVDQRSDVSGNRWTVTYSKDAAAGTHYPLFIDYTHNPLLGAVHRVNFIYETRSDLQQTFMAGAMVKTDRRLASIEIKTAGARVMAYQLSYQQQGQSYFGKTNNDPTNTSRLASVRRCYSSDAVCTVPLSFKWDFNNAEDLKYTRNPAEHYSRWENYYNEQYTRRAGHWRLPEGQTIDINKDGYPDTYFHPIPAAFKADIPIEYLGNRYKVYRIGASSYYEYDRMTSYPAPLAIEPRDVNNDGYTDIVINAPESLGVEVYLNIDVNGTRQISSIKSTEFSIAKDNVSFIATQQKDTIDSHFGTNSVSRTIRGVFGYKVSLVDMNGDGRLDAVRHPTDYRTTDFLVNLTEPAWRLSDANCVDSIYKCVWLNENGQVDINAGRADISVAFNQGNGFGSFQTYFDFRTQPGFWFQKVQASFNDVNSDGLVDFLAGWTVPGGSNTTTQGSYVYINNGKGAAGGALTPVTWGYHGSNISKTTQLLGDFNGDGYTDSVQIPRGDTDYSGVWELLLDFGDDKQWDFLRIPRAVPQVTYFTAPAETMTVSLGKGGVKQEANVALSVVTPEITFPMNLAPGCGSDIGHPGNDYYCRRVTVDANADGRTDIVEMWVSDRAPSAAHYWKPVEIYDAAFSSYKPNITYYEARVYLSKSADNTLNLSFSDPIVINSLSDFNAQINIASLKWMLSQTQFADANQDGQLENNYLQINNARTQKITAITSEAGEASVTFTPIQTDKPFANTTESQQGLTPDTPSHNFVLKPSTRQWVVSQLEVDNGTGTRNKENYDYFDLKTHTAGYGNLGFGRIIKTDTVAGETPLVTTTDYYQETHSRYALAGRPKRQQVRSGNQLLSDTRYQWKIRLYNDDRDAGFSSPHYFAYLYQSSAQTWDLDGTKFSDSLTQQGAYRTPSCDLLSESPSVITANAGYGDDNDYHADGVLLYSQQSTCDTSNSSASVQIKAAENLYISAQGNARGLVGRSIQYAWVGNSVSAASKPFYQARTKAFGYHASGQLGSETIEPDAPPLTHNTYYDYNAYGSVSRVTEAWNTATNNSLSATSRVTEINETIASDGKRSVTVTHPHGLTETTEFHPVWGAATKTTDANSLVTTTTFDEMGRPTLMNYADGTRTQIDYRSCAGCFGYSSTARWYQQIKTTGSAATREYSDGFGRTVGSRAHGLNGQFVFSLQTYNARGKNYQTSDAFYEGAAPRYVTQTYDALGRASQMIYADGAIESRLYNGLMHRTINRSNQTQTRFLNAAGWVMRSFDNAGTPVDFAYWPFGELRTTQVNYDARTQVSVDYDNLGRKIRMIDPNAGTTHYTYNALGLIATQTDANNQRTCFGYDLLERQIRRVDNADGNCAGRTQQWSYDSQPYGKGQLASLSGANTDGSAYSETYTYTALSLPNSVVRNFGGNSYTIAQQYDAFSRPAGTVYPSGYTATNRYNDYGHLSGIQDSTGTQVWAANDADATGNLTRFTLGNGVVTDQTFDANYKRIQSIRASKNGLVIQDQSYAFDSLGNMTSRTDNKNAITQSFCYDNMNRLVAARFNGCSSASNDFSYDRLGNLTQKEGIGSLGYGGSRPHAVTSANGWSYIYDNSGNLTSASKAGEATKTVSYSPFNTPTSITQGSKFSNIVYGPNQERITQSDSNGRATKYIGGIYEEVTKNGVTQKLHYVGGNIMFVQVGGATPSSRHEYLHKDHIGSIVAITNSTLNAANDIQWQSNGAWGERRFQQWNGPIDNSLIPNSTAKGFTDHEHLDAVGLIHMNGRVYDPELGRFLSADPFVQAPYNSQSYNRYSYVFNNPLSFTDPSGYNSVGGPGYCPGHQSNCLIQQSESQSQLQQLAADDKKREAKNTVTFSGCAGADGEFKGSDGHCYKGGGGGETPEETANKQRAAFLENNVYQNYLSESQQIDSQSQLLGTSQAGAASEVPCWNCPFVSSPPPGFSDKVGDFIDGALHAAQGIPGEGAIVTGSIKLSSVLSVKFVNIGTNMHHAWPKYLGGPAKQTLIKLDKEMHKLYHSGLDVVAPRWKGAKHYQNLPSDTKNQILSDFASYTRSFDAKYGTNLFQSAVDNGFKVVP